MDGPLAELRERIARIETDIDWLKNTVKRLDSRLWWVLGSVVGLGIIVILIAVLS